MVARLALLFLAAQRVLAEAALAEALVRFVLQPQFWLHPEFFLLHR